MSTQNISFPIYKKITLIYPKSTAMGFCIKVLKNEFETAVLNKPSVLELLHFYCIHLRNADSLLLRCSSLGY